MPAFLGEAHFNAQSYSLNYARTPERRELDYVRQTGASVETAKEVKIFGLNAFLIERYRALADALLRRQPPARRSAAPAGAALLTAIGTVGYYVAYAFIAWRTLRGDFTHRRPHVPRPARSAGCATCSRACSSASRRWPGQALYLDDLFSFFEIQPEIVSPPNPRPFPRPIRAGLRVRGRRLPLSRAPSAGRCAT